MAKIACGVTECSHNKNGDCFANIVSITGPSAHSDSETACSSFLDQMTYSELTNCQASAGGACDCLECHVKTCKHNENCNCQLDHIKVNGDNVSSYCQTNCLSFED